MMPTSKSRSSAKPDFKQIVLDALRRDLADVGDRLSDERRALQLARERLAHCDRQLLQGSAAHVDMFASSHEVDMSCLMEDRGDLSTAVVFCRRAVEDLIAAHGERHASTIDAKRKLASLLHDTGDMASAEPLYREVLEVRQTTLGATAPETLSSTVDLAMAYRDRGDLAAAEPLLRWAMVHQLRSLGEAHLETLCTTGNLTDLLRERGSLVEAARVLGDAPALAHTHLGPLHMTTLVLDAKAAALRRAAAMVQETERGDSRLGPGSVDRRTAEALMGAAVQRMVEALGRAHPQSRKYAAVLAAWQSCSTLAE